MIHQELLFYIKEQQKRGVSNATIKDVLMKEGGWHEADVNEALSFAVAPTPQPELPKKELVTSPTVSVSPKIVSEPAQVNTSFGERSQVAPLGTVAMSDTMAAKEQSRSQVQTSPVPAVKVETPIQQVEKSSVTIGTPAAAVSMKEPVAEPIPTTFSPYAPTKAGSTPAFTGMDTRIMLEKAKPVKPEKKRRGRFVSFIFVLLLLIVLGGGGAYAYVTYVNPNSSAAFSRAYGVLSNTTSLRFGLEATSNDLSPSIFSFIPSANETEASATVPTQNTEESLAVSKLSLSGTIDKGTSPIRYTLTSSLTSPLIPIAASFQAQTIQQGLAFKFPNVGYYIERFGLTNEAQSDSWYSIQDADLINAVSTNSPIFRALVPVVMGSAQNTFSLEKISKYNLITPTVIMPRVKEANKTYLRYQFTVSKDGLRMFAKDLLEAGQQGVAASQEQLAEIDRVLETLTFSNGEIWITPFTFRPYKISFTVLGLEGSAIPFKSLSVSLTLSGYGDPYPSDVAVNPTSFNDLIQTAVLKQKDTRVESLLSQSRVQAEMYYSKRRTYKNLCTGSAELTTTFSEISAITGATPVCFSESRKYAIASALPGDVSAVACVDSAGTNGHVAALPTKTQCQ